MQCENMKLISRQKDLGYTYGELACRGDVGSASKGVALEGTGPLARFQSKYIICKKQFTSC